MTIALTTPLEYPAEHGCPAETLGEVKIIDFHVSIVESWLTITTQYGNTVDGTWIPGCAAGNEITVRNEPAQFDPADLENSILADPAYNILVGTSLTSAAGVPTYGEVSKGLYQFLVDKEHYIGTVNP